MASKLFEWQNDSGEYLDHYEISKDNGATWIDIGMNTTYLWENIDIEGIYVFKVKALNSRGDSSNESSWTFEYIKDPELNKITTDFSYTNNTSKTFEWSLSSGSLDHYEISKDGGASWINNGTNTSYTWKNINYGSYSFKVRAVNIQGEYSNEIECTFEVIM